jgi:nitrate/nitrite transporter NarK
MDIGPRYAGVIMGMQTTAGNIAGIIVPVVVGFVVSYYSRWDLIFYIASAVLIIGVIIWDLFATGRQVLD